MPSALGTSRNTPRPTIRCFVFSMPHFCAPKEVTSRQS